MIIFDRYVNQSGKLYLRGLAIIIIRPYIITAATTTAALFAATTALALSITATSSSLSILLRYTCEIFARHNKKKITNHATFNQSQLSYKNKTCNTLTHHVAAKTTSKFARKKEKQSMF